ncbi:MAG: amidohydrolase [Bacteroidales bacterium]|nr:amidohydrolase [Bacteroidales bacterium]
MERLLIKDVLHEGRTRNILIEGKCFKDLDAPAEVADAKVLDATGTAILPALYNTHTHAAMTLLRGYADDMPLQTWLNDYIWPFEARLTPEDIRRGSEIAVREMLESGSVFFNDMYFNVEETIGVVDKAGMRAAIGITVMENHTKAVEEQKKEFVRQWHDPTGGRIQLVMAPHAIYTVGERKLRECAEFARDNGMLLHIHLSETETEVENCVKEHSATPVRYLDRIGFLGPDVIAAHCVHVDDGEAGILAERGVTVSHCPCSNMKLGSGIFPYARLIKAGCRITLGTDGASSGNNLDLREAMKFAALLAKAGGDPELLPAEEVFRWATRSSAEAFGLAAGAIAEGFLADCLLIDLSDIRMQPCHNLVSNFVYAADSRCIKHVLCDGRIVV